MPPQTSPAPGPLIGIVGPCGSGKSTLAARLVERGLGARAIAQEHSYVPAMWKLITNPELLVFLQASYPVCTQRRQLVWTESEYEEQLRRLAHAYAHADLRLDTDSLTPGEVLSAVMGGLGLEPHSPQEV